MTVEIVGDEITAHVDPDHVIVGRHSILDRERTYFAFQVDEPSAAFDDVAVHHAKRHPDWESRRDGLLAKQAARPPVDRPDDERLKILWQNARDRLYRTDETYRGLVRAIDVRHAEERERYPEVFVTHKEVRKKLQERQRQLRENDEAFRDLERRINRAKRAEETFLREREPSLADLPRSRYESALARTRNRLADDPAFVAIVAERTNLEKTLRNRYAELFVSDAEIVERRNAVRRRLNADPAFKATLRATADAVNAEKSYVREAVPAIVELEDRMGAR